jgi:hypothetical protein
VTANDALDADTGPNNLQNFPVLTAVMTNGASSATVAGSLNSAPSTTYRVELFASSAADPTGFGEGERYLGFATVSTDAAGNAVFGATVPAAVGPGEWSPRPRPTLEQHLGVQRGHHGREPWW